MQIPRERCWALDLSKRNGAAASAMEAAAARNHFAVRALISKLHQCGWHSY
jgi:hypothetical protein